MKRPNYFSAKDVDERWADQVNTVRLWRAVIDQVLQDLISLSEYSFGLRIIKNIKISRLLFILKNERVLYYIIEYREFYFQFFNI